jgi:acetylornithine deacetylase/succinyl-diaminopimelate desuccinylase-like protein
VVGAEHHGRLHRQVVFPSLGVHGYGWSPFILYEDEFRRIHGNDERISLDNVGAGAGSYTEMLLAVAAA